MKMGDNKKLPWTFPLKMYHSVFVLNSVSTLGPSEENTFIHLFGIDQSESRSEILYLDLSWSYQREDRNSDG